MTKSKYLTAPIKTDKMPPGIGYIIGNEIAERFCYYGINAILPIFMATQLLDRLGHAAPMSEAEANGWYHTWIAWVYLLPFIGALLADAVWGKYRTIMWLSIVYCCGNLVLSGDHTRLGLAIGLLLIAMGAGGIKPCVSANVGDQFGSSNQHLLPRIFTWFYFAINIGSAFSSLITPWLLDPPAFSQIAKEQIKDPPAMVQKFQQGADPISHFIWTQFQTNSLKGLTEPKSADTRRETLANELNRVLVVTSLYDSNRFAGVILGQKTKDLLAQQPTGQMRILLNRLLISDAYPQDVPPSEALNLSDSSIRFWSMVHGPAIAFGLPGVFMFMATVLFWSGRNKFVHIPHAGLGTYMRELFVREHFKALLNLLILVPFAAIYWSVWYQNFSSWVFQAEKMNRNILGHEWLPNQIQTANPVLVLVFLPFFAYVVFPIVGKFCKITPLRKFGAGLFCNAIAFFIVWVAQKWIDAGQTPSVLWQLLAFVPLTMSEVLVSVTHLEFSYIQAPKKMKSLVMCLYLGSIALGNILVAKVNFMIENKTLDLPGAKYFMFFLVIMLVTAVLFLLVAQFYRGKTYIQDEAESPTA
jgi:dipeptide/tripeptide permease